MDMMNILPSILSSFKSLKDMCNVLQSECEAIKIVGHIEPGPSAPHHRMKK